MLAVARGSRQRDGPDGAREIAANLETPTVVYQAEQCRRADLRVYDDVALGVEREYLRESVPEFCIPPAELKAQY
jgi:hypothetical protein